MKSIDPSRRTASLARRLGIVDGSKAGASRRNPGVEDFQNPSPWLTDPLPAAMAAAFLGIFSGLWQVFALGGLWVPIGLLSLASIVLCWSACRSWVLGGATATTTARSLSETIPSDTIVLSPTGEITVLGRRAERLLGLSPGTPDPLRALAAKARDKRDMEALLAAAREGRGLQMAVDMKAADGRGRLLIATVEPRRGGAAVIRFVDASYLRAAAETERAGRKWFSDYLEAMPVGVFAVDGGGHVVYANARVRALFGLEPRDVETGGRCFSEFVDSRAGSRGDGGDWLTIRGVDGRFRASVRELPANRGGHEGPARFVLMSQAESPWDLTANDAGDGSVGVAGGGLRALFEDAPVGVLLADANATVTHCNRSFYKLLGRHSDMIVGMGIGELVSPEDRADLNAQLSKIVMGTARVAHIEVKIPASGARSLVTSLFAGRLEDDLGDMTGLVVHVLDNTERKNLEEQFGQSQKMQAVGQLAGGVAHDFNNLLTAMIGFTDLLLTRHGQDDPDFSDLMQIKQNANRATDLVRQLLAFSRKQKLRPEIMDPVEALNDLQNLLSRLIGGHIKLSIEHGPDIGNIRADRGQFDQVIVNLVVNARDAMPSGGEIDIGTKTEKLDEPVTRGSDVMVEGDYVLITIADTGRGIAKEDINRIFEPFFSTKEIGAGTGLGLSTVHGIVHQSGGVIFVDSAIGEGTTFSIYLPVDNPVADETMEIAERRKSKLVREELDLDDDLPSANGGMVLLVEDEHAVRSFAARALRNKGHTVVEAEDGETALEIFNDHDGAFDLILSDISMPGMDGKTMVGLIREERPDVKVIMMSGYADDLHLESMEKHPAMHFLAKPFTLKALVEKIRDVLG